MSTPMLDNHEPEEITPGVPVELDLHDLEAMQQIINQAAHAMSERIMYLDAALTAANTAAETSRDFTKKLEFRVNVLSGFANWMIDAVEDPDRELSYGQIRSRANRALNAWPDETPEAVPPPRQSADSRDWFPYPTAPEAAGA